MKCRSWEFPKPSGAQPPFPESLSLETRDTIFIPAHFLHAQVLSPGDVAFTLGAGNDSYIVSNSAEWDPNNICMSLTSLIGGLVMLLGQYLSYIGKISIKKMLFRSLTFDPHLNWKKWLISLMLSCLFSGVLVVASFVASFMHCQMRKRKTKKVPQ